MQWPRDMRRERRHYDARAELRSLSLEPAHSGALSVRFATGVLIASMLVVLALEAWGANTRGFGQPAWPTSAAAFERLIRNL